MIRCPELGGSKPRMTSVRVVLPDPDAPTIAYCFPNSNSRSTLLIVGIVESGKVNVILLSAITIFLASIDTSDFVMFLSALIGFSGIEALAMGWEERSTRIRP